MLVKSMTFKQHLLDLKEVFVILSQIPDETQPFQMCFRYQGKKISWVFISSKGIEPNLKKIQTILDMMPPQNMKEVQCFIERLTALNKFIARLGECKH